MARACIAYVVVYVSIAAYGPYLQPYYRSIGIGLGEIGLLVALSSLVSLVSAPTWGTLNDRNPKSRLLMTLAALLAIGGALGIVALGRSPFLPLAVAAFAGGLAGLSPMMDVRVLDMFAADRSRYALVRLWGSIGFMVAAPIIGLAMDRYGERTLFVPLVGALALGALAVQLLPARSATIRTAGIRRAPMTVLHHRPILLFLAGALVAWVAVAAQGAFFSINLQNLGTPSNRVGLAWSIASFFEIPIMLSFPRLARRFGTERLIVLGAAIVTIREAANAAFADPAVLMFFQTFQGAGYALLLVGGITFVSEHAPKGTAATAQGILSGVSMSLANILGSGIGGFGASLLTIRGMFAASAAVGGLAVVLIALAVLPNALRRAREAPEAAAPAAAPAVTVPAATGAVENAPPPSPVPSPNSGGVA